MSTLKSKKKSSRKQMTNRSSAQYHFKVMAHFDNLRRTQKAQSGAPKQASINKSTGRGN